MPRSKSIYAVLSLLILSAIILGSCASPTSIPPTAQIIVQTVEVQKEVTKIVAGTPVVEKVTQQVIKEVTATPAPTKNPYDEKAPIKVMADNTRYPAIELFIKAHPESKDLVQVMTDQRDVFLNKLLLYNNVGSGWLDVIFHETEQLRIANTAQYDHFMGDLTPWVDKALVDKFYPGSLAGCKMPDGTLICLRNDIAPNMLYFNVKNMKDWGYTVPTTWEEFYALAQKVSKEHPKTSMLAINFAPWTSFFVGSECPMMNPISATKYYIDFLSPNCQRMAKMLDDLYALGVMDPNGAFSPDDAKHFSEGKWLTKIGPAWEADYVLKGVLLDPTKPEFAGIVGMAPMVKWADQKQIWTGSTGGASWGMSRHSKNPKLASQLIIFVTTDPSVTSVAVTLSAFQPGGDAWAKTLVNRNPLIAKDPDPYIALNTMGSKIWPDFLEGPPLASAIIGPFAGNINSGKTTWVKSSKDIQAGLVENATKAGYEVVTTKP